MMIPTLRRHLRHLLAHGLLLLASGCLTVPEPPRPPLQGAIDIASTSADARPDTTGTTGATGTAATTGTTATGTAAAATPDGAPPVRDHAGGRWGGLLGAIRSPGSSGPDLPSLRPPPPPPRIEPAPEPVTVQHSRADVVTTVQPAPAPPTDALADFAGLPRGAGAVSAPSRVRRGDTFAVRAMVGPGASVALLEKLRRVEGGTAPPGLQFAGRDNVKLTRSMIATLYAPDMTVQPSAAQRQSVDRVDGALWEWLVTANKSGEYRLMVEVTGELPGRGGQDVHRFYSWSQALTVEVTAADWLGQHWQWLSGAVLFPLAPVVWKWWRRQRAPAPAINWDG